jgi:hypothetical protein
MPSLYLEYGQEPTGLTELTPNYARNQIVPSFGSVER